MPSFVGIDSIYKAFSEGLGRVSNIWLASGSRSKPISPGAPPSLKQNEWWGNSLPIPPLARVGRDQQRFSSVVPEGLFWALSLDQAQETQRGITFSAFPPAS